MGDFDKVNNEKGLPKEAALLEAASDLALLEKYRQFGDRDALGKLFERHSAWVYRTAQGLMGSASLAEDAMQNVFLELMNFAKRFDANKATVRQWLAGILFNVCRQQRRRRRNAARREQAAGEEYAMKEQYASDQGDERSDHDESKHLIRREVDRLPEKIRVPILLRFYEGFSVQEAAASLGVEEPTLRARLRKGLDLLKTRLEKTGVAVGSISVLTKLMLETPPLALPEHVLRCAVELARRPFTSSLEAAASAKMVGGWKAVSAWFWGVGAVALVGGAVGGALLMNNRHATVTPGEVQPDNPRLKVYLELARRLKDEEPELLDSKTRNSHFHRPFHYAASEIRPSPKFMAAMHGGMHACLFAGECLPAERSALLKFYGERLETEARALYAGQPPEPLPLPEEEAKLLAEVHRMIEEGDPAANQVELRNLLRDARSIPARFLLLSLRNPDEADVAALVKELRSAGGPWSVWAEFWGAMAVSEPSPWDEMFNRAASLAAASDHEMAAALLFDLGLLWRWQYDRRREALVLWEEMSKKYSETSYARFYRDIVREYAQNDAQREFREEALIDFETAKTEGPGTWRIVSRTSENEPVSIEYSGGDGSPAMIFFPNVRHYGVWFTCRYQLLDTTFDFSRPTYEIEPVVMFWPDAQGGGKRTRARIFTKHPRTGQAITDVYLRTDSLWNYEEKDAMDNTKLNITANVISEPMSLNLRRQYSRTNWPKNLPPDPNAPYGLALTVNGVKRARFSHFGIKSICPPPFPVASCPDVTWDFSNGLPQDIKTPDVSPEHPGTIHWSATAGRDGGGLVVAEEAWLVFPVAWPRECFVMEWDAKPYVKDKNYGASLGLFDGRQLREPKFYNFKQEGGKLVVTDSWLRFKFLVDSRKSHSLLVCSIVGRAKQGYLNEQFVPWAAFNHCVTLRLSNQYIDNFRIRPATSQELEEAESWYESRPTEKAPKKQK